MTTSTVTVSVTLLTILAIYKTVSRLIVNFLWNKFALVKDVPLLSKARPRDEKFSGTAIICGGSISGLFAARVCANHFENVLIIEPEEWVAVGEKGLTDHHRDPNAQKRSRVAQYTSYHHFHFIITMCMKEMFSTFEKEIKSAGGRFTVCYSSLMVSGIPRVVPSHFPFYSGGNCEEVLYLHGTVTGLLYDEKLNRASGVNVRLSTGENTEIQGNLVIDATGSFMAGHRWLKAIPKFASSHSPSLDDIKISFEPKVNYTLAEFALPPALEEDLRQYKFPTDQDEISSLYASLSVNSSIDRFFSIDKREKNFLQINCGGYGWNGTVRSVGEIEEFIRDVDSKLKRPLPQWMYDVLHTLQGEDVPVSYQDCKYPSSSYIKYHKAKSLPSNFVALGDAQCQTDPVFAQGCSKACATAIILNYQLHRSSRDAAGFLPPMFSKGYFLDVKNRTEHTWKNMKNMDYNYKTTVPLPGENLETTARFMRAFTDIFLSLTTKDPDISGVFSRNVQWLEPPTTMLAPWVIRRVAWAWVKQLFGYEIL